MEYIKRSTKKNRQQLLEQALKEELFYLRKKIYPYKRHDFLFDDIEIQEKEFTSEESAIGQYEWDEENCVHRIWIEKEYIIRSQKSKWSCMRKLYYKELKNIVRHELIHGFVESTYEWRLKQYITNKNRDCSPIFLSILCWAGGITHHDCFRGFKQTELYKKIKQFNTYKELKDYLEEYLLEFLEVIQQIKDINNKTAFTKNEELDFKQIVNNFEFAPRKNGLEKYMELQTVDIYKKDGEFHDYDICHRTWRIGSCITPSMLLDLYNKKQDSKATYFCNRKQLVIVEDQQCAEVKNVRTVTIREDNNF